jgi:hypothetical protein
LYNARERAALAWAEAVLTPDQLQAIAVKQAIVAM